MEISGIIPSIQLGSLLYKDAFKEILSDVLIKSAPAAIRVEGTSDTLVSRVIYGGTVIACAKIDGKITPSVESAIKLKMAGADYVATGAIEYSGAKIVEKMVEYSIPVIADVASIESAKKAVGLGCAAVSTTLSGYVGERKHEFFAPDLYLVEQCAKLGVLTIAEGRYWFADDIVDAKNAGASAVCIGKSITNIGDKANFYKTVWETA